MKLNDFLIERPLTTKEKGKKEKYVKGMKKAKGDFEDRYGKDAKAVMYATATKMAKKKKSKKSESFSEDIDLNDGMIGSPDSYYDEEERKEAYEDLKDALDMFAKGYEQESVMQGICPNCAGTGYQDGEDQVYNDETDEYEEGNECDGYGQFGCDQGEMTGASWVEIIRHDERNAERQKAKDNYPGDEAVIDQIARAVKQLDDPRQMYQYMKADYPFMGIGQRSKLIAQGMKKAGLTSESINEGEERSIIKSGCIDVLVGEFSGEEHQFENLGDLEYAIYSEMERLDVDDCADPNMVVGGQRIGDFASGSVLDIVDSSSVIDDVMSQLDTSELEEGRIEDTFDTKRIDKHDRPEKKKKKKDMEEKAPSDAIWGIFADGKDITARYADKFEADKHAEELSKNNPGVKYEVKKADTDKIEEKSEDSNEAMVSKMLAKALGDDNRWADMSSHELYAELESESPEKADMIALMAKMLYDIRLKEGRDSPQHAMDLEKVYKIDHLKDCPLCTGGGMDDMGLPSGMNKRGDDICPSCSGFGKLGVVDYVKELEPMHKKGQIEWLKQNYRASFDPDNPRAIKDEMFEAEYSDEASYDCDDAFFEDYGYLGYSIDENDVFEAEYRGRKVKLNKPMQGDVKKFKVYVKDPKTGNVKKVNFGHGGSSVKGKSMRIRKSNPKARKSFRARHNCDNPGPKTKARYWSCRKW